MKKILPWLAVAAVLMVVFGTIYTTVQQAQRDDANYPQIQTAEDIASALNHGDVPLVLVNGNVDMNKSLASFTIIYDKSGRVVMGSGYLNGHVPQAPIGTLEASKGKDYSAVTWEPADNIRIASVTVSADRYYVLSGRSLKEVEKNETKTLELSFLGGVASLIVLGIVFVLFELAKY